MTRSDWTKIWPVAQILSEMQLVLRSVRDTYFRLPKLINLSAICNLDLSHASTELNHAYKRGTGRMVHCWEFLSLLDSIDARRETVGKSSYF